MNGILTAKGQNGQIEFDGQNVTIKRGGFYGTMTTGRGVKVIPVQSITGVRYRKASLGGTMRGYIEFTVPGAVEQRSRAGHVAVDELHAVVTSVSNTAAVTAIRRTALRLGGRTLF